MKHPRPSSADRIEVARDLWGWIPHPTQRKWLLDEHPVKVAACGRRWGKTEAAAVDVATYAIANNGSVQMIVAPTYDQSKLISGTVERLLLRRDYIRRYTQITRTPYPDIRYRGSRIMARTADEDGRNLRGHSADRVIVDEAAFVRDEVIEEVIGPMLADRNGQLVMISTPFGKNHFYRAFVQGQADMANGKWSMAHSDKPPEKSAINHQPSAINHSEPRVRSFRFPSWKNPHISREYIEYQRAVLADRQFRAEYEAEFIDDQSSVFPWSDIQAAMSADLGFRNADCGLTRTEGGIRVAGIDWARYTDYTAVVVAEMVDGEWRMADGDVSPEKSAVDHQPSTISHPRCRVIALDRFNRMDWHTQVERVCDFLAKHGVIAVAADQTSVGDPVLEILQNSLWGGRETDIAIEGVVFTNQIKRELVDNLAVRLAHREVAIPWDEQLIRELQHYEYELTESGNVRTGARRGYHDDCVMALALALHLAPRYGFVGGRFLSSGRTRISARGW
jgi:hypothetical protein